MLRLIARSILLAGILLAGCATTTQRAGSPISFDSLSPREQGIYLALFHRMFAHCEARTAGSSLQFFIALKGHDAGPDLLSHFQTQGYRVAPGSQCENGGGIQCSAGRVEMISATQAKVHGGYLFGPRDGAWGHFYLKEVDGQWTVVAWEIDSISQPEPKKETAPEPKKAAVPEPKKETAPAPKQDAPTEPKKEGAAPEGTPTAEPNKEAAPEGAAAPGGTTTTEPQKEGAPATEGAAAPAEPKKEGATTTEGPSATEPKKEAAPPPEGAAAAEPKKETAP